MITPAFVQGAVTPSSTQALNAGNSFTATLAYSTQATAAGNLLVATAGFFVSSTPISLNQVTDTQNNSWTVFQSEQTLHGETVYFLATAYALNTNGGSKPTVSFIFSGAGTVTGLSVGEYSGVNALRGSASDNSGSNSGTSGSVTPVVGDLMIGMASTLDNSSFAFSTPASGATIRETSPEVDTCQTGFGDYLATSATSQHIVIGNGGGSVWATGLLDFIPGLPPSGGSASWLTVALTNSLRGLRH